MPSSRLSQVPYVLDLILRRHYKQEKIHSVLDVGIGWGKYGLLIREYISQLDIMKPKESWKLRLDGVEIYSTYIKKYIKNLYNNIFIVDIRDFCKTPEKWSDQPQWDLILMADIVEHLEKKEGFTVIENLLKHCKWLVISTPTVMEEQPVHLFHGNEQHLSLWERNDFSKYIIKGMHHDRDFIAIALQGRLLNKKEETFLFLPE